MCVGGQVEEVCTTTAWRQEKVSEESMAGSRQMHKTKIYHAASSQMIFIFLFPVP